MQNYKKRILLVICFFFMMMAGCSQKETDKPEPDNLTGSYHAKNTDITIQITDENKIIFHAETKDSLKNLMEKLIIEKIKAKPAEGFMEDLLEGLQSGSEFTKTDTELLFHPVEDDGFSLNVKYFNDGTIAFLDESYEK